MDWICVVHDKNEYSPSLNTKISIHILYKAMNFMIIGATMTL